MKQMIWFKEKNVDGCGTNVDVFVEVDAHDELKYEHQQEIKRIATHIKENSDEDITTDDIINDALKEYFDEGETFKIIQPDLYISF